MVWGSDYFPRVTSPHWAERSIGAHLLFVAIKSMVIFQFQMLLNWMINTAIFYIRKSANRWRRYN